MTRTFSAARSALYVLAGAAALLLGGCGGEGIELNGKIFDAVGLSGNAEKSAEPKMAQRTGIVVPPNTGSLPVPGSRAEGDSPDLAAIQDPDKIVQVSQAEKERQQAEYCKKNYEEAMQRGDSNADLATGPLGPCRGSVISALQQWQKGSSNDDDADQQ